jgi:hypothetical protein
MEIPMKPMLLLASAAALSAGLAAQDTVPLRLSTTAVHSATVRVLADGVCEVRTTGGDPYVLCERLTTGFDHRRLSVFAFEYTCSEALEFFEVFLGNPFVPENHYGSGPLPPAPEWTRFAVDLGALPGSEWGEDVRDFRIDFGDRGGRVVQVRSLQLRAPTPAEIRAVQERQAAADAALKAVQERVEKTLIAPAKIPAADNAISATSSLADAGGLTLISVVGRDLDLVTQVASGGGDVAPAAALPPALVVGEGESEGNHTVIRILNRYGLCEVQFLAYPETVRGGVAVAAGRAGDGQPVIVTAPLTDESVRDLRLFGRYGNLLGTLRVGPELRPPFVIAVGDFRRGPEGDEVAVAARAAGVGPTPVRLYSLSGSLLQSFELPATATAGGRLCLSAAPSPGGATHLLAYAEGSTTFRRLDTELGTTTVHEAGLSPDCTGVFASAVAAQPLAATCREPLHSSLVRLGDAGPPARQDVGTRENRFWFTTDGKFSAIPQGRYVRHSRFAHIRTDFASPMASTPDFARTDIEFWTGERFAGWVAARLQSYDSDPPTCWEPCFTHRWFYGQAKTWAAALDPETGLPSYTLVTRDNETGTYGEFGETKSFVSGSYAPGVTPIDCFYTYPQRRFLQGLATRFRANPEHFVAVEPNHEMEINAESQETHGDYNPNMIRAFYGYLTGLYGDLDGINRVFGTAFSPARFDAPRNLRRGTWDAYATGNPYYLVWMRFLNYVIYRVVAGTYREALLAGFPPEAIKCHQIPDHYAIASLTAFSRPAQRITPIDWNLNAGVGFGFTKYGVWFNQEHNCVQGPNSSGFDGMVVGEYQSLTPDADAAFKQLEYMQSRGVQFVHCMNWPDGHDQGYNQALATALQRLVAADQPRPGQTGGTGEVRAVRQGDRAYDIVSLGTLPETTGLLKSVTATGAWEGTVYVVPFHARVAVETLLARETADLAAEPLRFGPFPAIDAGNLIDCSFAAKSAGPGQQALTLRLYHHGVELPAQALVLPVGPEWRQARLLVRVQMDLDDLALELGSGDGRHGTWRQGHIALQNLSVVRHSEKTAKLKKGVLAGERHTGGVRFDVLPEVP